MKYATMALMLASCLFFQGCVHHHGAHARDGYTPAPVVHHVVTPAPRHDIQHPAPHAAKAPVHHVAPQPKPHPTQHVRHGEPHRARHHVENRPHKAEVHTGHNRKDGGHRQVGQLSHRGR